MPISTNMQAHGCGPACFIGGWLLSAYLLLIVLETLQISRCFRLIECQTGSSVRILPKSLLRRFFCGLSDQCFLAFHSVHLPSTSKYHSFPYFSTAPAKVLIIYAKLQEFTIRIGYIY